MKTHAPVFLEKTSCFISADINTQRPDLLEMADLPHRHHGNFPQRSSAPLPQLQNVSNHLCNGKMPSEQQILPARSVAALLKRI
ncbi:hypothetical protein INR49_017518, partial [Caranx melampygus]